MMDTSSERTLKSGLAHHLRNHATGLLNAAQRLDGDAPAMHNNAEFQALEIMHKELGSLMLKFRSAFRPYGVEQ